MKQKKVLVAGLGLIGGSMAAAISEKTPHLVYGYDIDTETQQKALADGAIAQAWEKDGDFDLVLIALYPSAAISFLENFGPSFASSCVVVDLCGVKQSVCQAARKIFTKGKGDLCRRAPHGRARSLGLCRSQRGVFLKRQA
jgi:prephenate dehydrogenase